MLVATLTPSNKPSVFLIAIACGVLFSSAMRLMLNFNGGHIDEYDYLFVGKQLLAGKDWGTYFYIFGSNLNWYILGIGESLAGLSGARAMAGCHGTGCRGMGCYGALACTATPAKRPREWLYE